MIYLNALSSFCSHSCTQIYIWILKPMSNYALFIWCYICVKRTPLPPLPPRTPTYKIYGLGFRLILQSRGAEKVGGGAGARAPPGIPKWSVFGGSGGPRPPKHPKLALCAPPGNFLFCAPAWINFFFEVLKRRTFLVPALFSSTFYAIYLFSCLYLHAGYFLENNTFWFWSTLGHPKMNSLKFYWQCRLVYPPLWGGILEKVGV